MTSVELLENKSPSDHHWRTSTSAGALLSLASDGNIPNIIGLIITKFGAERLCLQTQVIITGSQVGFCTQILGAEASFIFRPSVLMARPDQQQLFNCINHDEGISILTRIKSSNENQKKTFAGRLVFCFLL